MGVAKKIEVSATGFPGTNKTWRHLQQGVDDAISALGNTFGNVIISGCNLTASNGVEYDSLVSHITSGVMCINGEVLPFEELIIDDEAVNVSQIYIRINEVNENVLYNDGTLIPKVAYKTRTFSWVVVYPGDTLDGTTGVAYIDLVRLPKMQNLRPVGEITMWSGAIANIPSGWALCDGNNNTPDLRDRFVLSAGNTYPVGSVNSLSEKEVTLTAAQSGLPTHSHYVTIAGNAGGGTFSIVEGGSMPLGVINGSQSGGAINGYAVNNNPADASAAHSNMPPYYALSYIMYVGLPL